MTVKGQRGSRLLNLHTVSWKERNNANYLPWQPQNPLYREEKDIVYAAYGCGHYYYNGSRIEILKKIASGVGRKKFYPRKCPKCFGQWQSAPAYSTPAMPTRRAVYAYESNLNKRIARRLLNERKTLGGL